MKRRIVIVFDGYSWYVRRLAYSVQDSVKGEIVYHCDKPILNGVPTLAEVVKKLKRKPARARRRR